MRFSFVYIMCFVTFDTQMVKEILKEKLEKWNSTKSINTIL